MSDNLYQFVEDLFPLNRSLTGNGVRQTLNYIKDIIPELNIYEIPTGTKCFDWTIPREWNCNDAYIITPEGEKICEFKKNNLHLVGYSIPLNKEMPFNELKKHLYFLEKQPDSIPYITSYYKENWGFCISYNQYKKLKDGIYKVKIDTTLENGYLTYGEVILKGEEEKEIFLSTYICHPSMANNELSGPAITSYLAKFISELKVRRYTYRIIFIPETIGSIMYLSKNHDVMKRNVISGFQITCVGDNNSFSYLPSRQGNSLADKVALHILENYCLNFKKYTYLDRGSDERQYCFPGIDLPVCSVMRTKYREYDEYHTSLDNLEYISPQGLFGAYKTYINIIEALECNYIYMANILCEPQLNKIDGLYSDLYTKNNYPNIGNILNFITYCDGKNDLIDISNIINLKYKDINNFIGLLIQNNIIRKI